jgi:molybdopterin-guanine dinucleotide biosynthesis protein A
MPVWDPTVSAVVPLWERQHRVLGAVADPVWRALAWDADAAPDALVDPAPWPGPLDAIRRAFERGAEWLLVLAVDMPGVEVPLLERLWAARMPGGVACAVVDSRWHGLLAVWHHETLPVLRAASAGGERRVRAVLEQLPVRGLWLKGMAARGVVNVNTPGEWEAFGGATAGGALDSGGGSPQQRQD